MKKPNIILITTDQQRFDTIQALGNPVIYTPHLNWLTDEGVTYTRTYAECPICVASRTSIMTGMRGYVSGISRSCDHSALMESSKHCRSCSLKTDTRPGPSEKCISTRQEPIMVLNIWSSPLTITG